MKPFTFPKNNITIKVQGYEPFCLIHLLENENISEEELIEGYKIIPVINYFQNDKKHYYYPDIYIPSKNLIIEVKSRYTFELAKETNLIKLETTVNKYGYNMEIRIYDRKGNCEEIIK